MKKTLATLAAAAFLLTGCVPDTDSSLKTRYIKDFSGKAHAFGADEKHIYLFTDSATYRFPLDQNDLELQQIIKDGRINRVHFYGRTCINSEVDYCRDRAVYRECPIKLTGDHQGKEVYELYIGNIEKSSMNLNGLDNQSYTLESYDNSNNNIPKDATVVLTEAQKAALIYRPLAEPLPICKRYDYKKYKFIMRPLFKTCCW